MKRLAWEPSVRQKLARFSPPPLLETPEALATSVAMLEEPLLLFSLLTREEAACIAASHPDYGEGRLFAKIYCAACGMDYEAFRQAEYAAYSFCPRSDERYGPMVASIYGLLSRTAVPQNTRLRDAVRCNASRELDDDMLSRFSLRWMSVADGQKAGYPKEIRQAATGSVWSCTWTPQSAS